MYAFEVVDDWTGDATYYSSLDQIPVDDGLVVRIYPIVCEDQKLKKSELIFYRDDQWVMGRETELKKRILLGNRETELKKRILLGNHEKIDTDEIISYDGYFFHCKNDLVKYMLDQGRINIIKVRGVTKVNRKPKNVTKKVDKKINKIESYQDRKRKLDEEMDEYHRSAKCNYERERLDAELDEYHRSAGCSHH